MYLFGNDSHIDQIDPDVTRKINLFPCQFNRTFSKKIYTDVSNFLYFWSNFMCWNLQTPIFIIHLKTNFECQLMDIVIICANDSYRFTENSGRATSRWLVNESPARRATDTNIVIFYILRQLFISTSSLGINTKY